jgi:hypothetical protein
MRTPEEMRDFDWVKGRAACSIETVFEKLRIDVESDIKTRNAVNERTQGPPQVFTIVNNDASFKVLTAAGTRQSGVKFSLGDKAITVTDSHGTTMFEATITLNDEGECRLKVNGLERETWQVRRTALEHLFFGT